MMHPSPFFLSSPVGLTIPLVEEAVVFPYQGPHQLVRHVGHGASAPAARAVAVWNRRDHLPAVAAPRGNLREKANVYRIVELPLPLREALRTHPGDFSKETLNHDERQQQQRQVQQRESKGSFPSE